MKIVSSGGAVTAEDRALLAEFSAELSETDTFKKMRVE
jgi:hypothetical protein